ncbi:MAG: hypothetical protein ABI411_20080, partial [Tahibacter sp.]
MPFSLFGSTSRGTAEVDFWTWFAANKAQLFSCETDREAIFDKVGDALHKVHPDLTFEFGPVAEGRREFVISADGVKAAFPLVESLYGSAPTLERWTWVKFRPRRLPIGTIKFAGKSIPSNDVHFLLASDEPKVGIVLFFDGCNEKEKNVFGQIGYLFLDEALGEYAVEM